MEQYKKYGLIGVTCLSVCLGGAYSYISFGIDKAYTKQEYGKAYDYLKIVTKLTSVHNKQLHDIIFAETASSFYQQEIVITYGISIHEEFFNSWAYTLRALNFNIPIQDENMSKLYEILKEMNEKKSIFKHGLPLYDQRKGKNVIEEEYYSSRIIQAIETIQNIKHPKSEMLESLFLPYLIKEHLYEYQLLVNKQCDVWGARKKDNENRMMSEQEKSNYKRFLVDTNYVYEQIEDEIEQTIENLTPLQKEIYAYGVTVYLHNTINNIYDNVIKSKEKITKKEKNEVVGMLYKLYSCTEKHKKYYIGKREKNEDLDYEHERAAKIISERD